MESKDPKIILSHRLVPKHEIVSESEAAKVFSTYGINKQCLPKLKADDPVVKAIGAKEGDVVRVSRTDVTADCVHYRLVVG